MDAIKPFFPFAFKVKEKDTNSLIIGIAIHLGGGIAISLVLGLVSLVIGTVLGLFHMPAIITWLVSGVFGLVGGVVDLYAFAGIIFSILLFCGVLKVTE